MDEAPKVSATSSTLASSRPKGCVSLDEGLVLDWVKKASESLEAAVSCAMSVGGGDMLRTMERWRESSTWAFLLWLGAR